jgi:hypothetical protein
MQNIHAKSWEDGYRNTSESYFSLPSKTSYGLGNQSLIPGRGRDCSHWSDVDEYGDHSASHPVGTRGSWLWDKKAAAWS